MKKIIITIALTITLVASLAQANLSGNWVGWGEWTFDGSGVVCNPMEMTWLETKNTVEISNGYFDCEIVAMHLGKTKWTIKDQQLFDETEKNVGTYDGKIFSVYMPSPNENTTIHIRVDRTRPTSYDYQEVWFNKYEKVYVIKGRFFNGQQKKIEI